VAANFCDISLGSDTGGSIRNPASHCGIIALKPTYGLVSRYGLIDLAMSLDQIGPLSKDVSSAALMLEVIHGRDFKEGTTLDISQQDFVSHLSSDLREWKIGFAQEYKEFTEPKIVREIKKGLDRLSSNGAEIVDIEISNLSKGISTYYLIEFFSGTRKFDGRRFGHNIENVCGREVLRRIMLGRYISQKEYSGKYYKKALQFRSLIKKELLTVLNNVDIIAGPTVPKLPHKIGDEVTDPLVMYGYDLLTVPANLAGIPSGVIKVGNVKDIPVGMQIQSKPLGEQNILNVMCNLEGEK
jgi:aspartyl-tRNA(Asn)/glutamyl-tRNA(Gln) amidotransferase subunit A